MNAAFSSWQAFFAMGGYAFYVWLAVAATLLSLLGYRSTPCGSASSYWPKSAAKRHVNGVSASHNSQSKQRQHRSLLTCGRNHSESTS